jgi:hypothetical protein
MEPAKLEPYRRGLRPALPQSLPSYLDSELQRLSVIITDLVGVVQALAARLDALEAP